MNVLRLLVGVHLSIAADGFREIPMLLCSSCSRCWSFLLLLLVLQAQIACATHNAGPVLFPAAAAAAAVHCMSLGHLCTDADFLLSLLSHCGCCPAVVWSGAPCDAPAVQGSCSSATCAMGAAGECKLGTQPICGCGVAAFRSCCFK